jgi:GT2 family glycosyltransferase
VLACIVLNYNDAASVIDIYGKISSYSVFDKVIIVDNFSEDDSYEKLISLRNEKTLVIKSDKNGGYGYGNNVGLRKCKELGIDYALVANPDVEFTEESIQKTYEFMKSMEKCVSASPRMYDHEPAFKFASPIGYFVSESILLNRLIRPKYYPKDYYNKPVVEVDVIPGSLVMFNVDLFVEAGLYDEKVFLYYEEYVIGQRFRRRGYKSYILMDCGYHHYHSVSVNKTYKSTVKVKKILEKSLKYYLRAYCGYNATATGVGIFQPFFCLETFIWSKLRFVLRKKAEAKKG